MKPATRKRICDHIIAWANKVDLSGINGNMYTKMLPTLSDEQLIALCKQPVPIYDPNGSEVKVEVMNNIKVLRQMGYEPFQHLWLTDPKTGWCSLTANKHLVLPLPVRRQTQLIEKKISYAEHNRTIDTMTGQVTGASKSSAFSFPQTYVMYAKGYDNTIRELIEHRGGNTKAGRVIDRNLRQSGHSSQFFDGYENTHTKSVLSAKGLFGGMHLGTSLGKTEWKDTSKM